MKASILVLFVALALAGGTGCKSKGPPFEPRPRAVTERLRADARSAAELEEAAFTGVAATNQINPDWLKPPKDFYRLGPGDLIEIETLGEGASRTTALVGPDGKVYYGLLPGTFVWGLTLGETRDAIERGMKKYLRVPPDITVTLKSVGSKGVWILGNVNAPGVYPLATPLTLLEAISLAGGPLSSPGSLDGVCDLRRSFVMRDGRLLPVDFDKLLRAGDMTQNIYLQPNDFVYLRSALTRNVYVLGAVAAPQVVTFTDDITLMSAILSCGGTVPYAQKGQVAIIRGSLAEPRVATVDYQRILEGRDTDVKLQAGDIVYVPLSPWRKLALLADTMLDQFVRTIAVNEGYRAVVRGAGPVGPVVPVGSPPPPAR